MEIEYIFIGFIIAVIIHFIVIVYQSQNNEKPSVEELAQRGNAKAQFILGFEYEKGERIEQIDKKVFYLYKKAAEQGNAKVQLVLGTMYGEGEGVEQSDEKAFYWYKKAAEQGDPQAQFSLGVTYLQGKGVPQSQTQAVHWLKKAWNNGVIEAYELLIVNGINNIIKDKK